MACIAMQLLALVLVVIGTTTSTLDLSDPSDGMGQQFFEELSLEIASLRMEKTSLLMEIEKLQSFNDELKSKEMVLTKQERLSIERAYENSTEWRPVDCADILMSGKSTSGVYDIYPFSCGCSKAIQVYCDMETDGGGWTVILNREENQRNLVSFNRSWEEYKEGFGLANNQYWLGNEAIHVLSTSRSYTLRMDLHMLSQEYQYLIYDNFRMDDEDNKYKLTLGSREPESSLSTDCLTYARNHLFSTYDFDNDGSSSNNCASQGGGGWWYSGSRCYTKYPPTGIYGENYLNVSCSSSYTYKVTDVQLKVRPTICDASYKRITVLGRGCNSECTGPVTLAGL